MPVCALLHTVPIALEMSEDSGMSSKLSILQLVFFFLLSLHWFFYSDTILFWHL